MRHSHANASSLRRHRSARRESCRHPVPIVPRYVVALSQLPDRLLRTTRNRHPGLIREAMLRRRSAAESRLRSFCRRKRGAEGSAGRPGSCGISTQRIPAPTFPRCRTERRTGGDRAAAQLIVIPNGRGSVPSARGRRSESKTASAG